MANRPVTKSVIDRLSSAGIGIREQVSVLDFLSELERHRFVVRGAISLSSEPTARAFVLDDLPSQRRIGRKVSRYGRVAFIEADLAGRAFGRWCKDGYGQIGGFKFVVPNLNEWATWERQPSLWTHGTGPLEWPLLRGEVNLPQQSPMQGDYHLLIQTGLPTFPSFGDGLSYYLFPGEHVPTQALPTAFVTVRIADTRCWIARMHFATAHILVNLKGREVVGARVELIGPQTWSEKTSGASGRVKIAAPRGVDPQQMLVVSKGDGWFDYRFLGRSAQEGQPGVTFERPDRCTEVAVLATQGEQQTVEYKRQLPASDGERAKLARTVVAFANTQGGYLIYGVEGDSAVGTQIIGVSYSPDVADTLVRIVRDRVIPDPGVEIVPCEVDGKQLVAVAVRSRSNRFFALNTTPPEFYVRRQANTFPASLSEIRELAATLVDQAAVPSWRRG